MCGFAGFYSRGGVSSSVLEAMTTSIKHRGPDDHGYLGISANGAAKLWKTPGTGESLIQVGLGFRRLAIIDLSEQGAQPMQTPDGRYWITFNGEIFNYLELAKDLGKLRSQSDTEVLLRLFASQGVASLSQFNGMFAFSIYDTATRQMWLVRDPFGVKPLYYFQDERGIFYSSEIRALLEAKRGVSLRTSLVARYLMANWVPDPDTLFDGIFKLEPGHFLKINSDLSVQKQSYWDLDFSHPRIQSSSEWRDELDDAIEAAVDRQLRSDVPVAFFLSGGVDSSLLAAKATTVRGERPTTFTIGFKWTNSKEDDTDLLSARLMSERFGFQHHEILLEPSIVELMPRIVRILEEPIADPAALCSDLICEAAAREKFKVMISGQGGDELFGGYPVYRGGMMAHSTQRLPMPLLSMLNVTSQLLPYSVAGKRLQTVHRLKKLFVSASHPWPEPFYLLRSAMSLETLGQLLTPEASAVQEPVFARHSQHFAKAENWDALHQTMYLDTKTYLPSLNLTYTDKTSMAHSVEVRVPFLDLDLARFVQALPSQYKMNMRQSKRLLKTVARLSLPREIIDRKKAGFGLPLRDWLLADLQPMASDLLSDSRLSRQKLFRPGVVGQWLKEHRERRADHSAKIYALMTLQLWLETFGVSG